MGGLVRYYAAYMAQATASFVRSACEVTVTRGEHIGSKAVSRLAVFAGAGSSPAATRSTCPATAKIFIVSTTSIKRIVTHTPDTKSLPEFRISP